MKNQLFLTFLTITIFLSLESYGYSELNNQSKCIPCGDRFLCGDIEDKVFLKQYGESKRSSIKKHCSRRAGFMYQRSKKIKNVRSSEDQRHELVLNYMEEILGRRKGTVKQRIKRGFKLGEIKLFTQPTKKASKEVYKKLENANYIIPVLSFEDYKGIHNTERPKSFYNTYIKNLMTIDPFHLSDQEWGNNLFTYAAYPKKGLIAARKALSRNLASVGGSASGANTSLSSGGGGSPTGSSKAIAAKSSKSTASKRRNDDGKAYNRYNPIQREASPSRNRAPASINTDSINTNDSSSSLRSKPVNVSAARYSAFPATNVASNSLKVDTDKTTVESTEPTRSGSACSTAPDSPNCKIQKIKVPGGIPEVSDRPSTNSNTQRTASSTPETNTNTVASTDKASTTNPESKKPALENDTPPQTTTSVAKADSPVPQASPVISKPTNFSPASTEAGAIAGLGTLQALPELKFDSADQVLLGENAVRIRAGANAARDRARDLNDSANTYSSTKKGTSSAPGAVTLVVPIAQKSNVSFAEQSIQKEECDVIKNNYFRNHESGFSCKNILRDFEPIERCEKKFENDFLTQCENIFNFDRLNYSDPVSECKRLSMKLFETGRPSQTTLSANSFLRKKDSLWKVIVDQPYMLADKKEIKKLTKLMKRKRDINLCDQKHKKIVGTILFTADSLDIEPSSRLSCKDISLDTLKVVSEKINQDWKNRKTYFQNQLKGFHGVSYIKAKALANKNNISIRDQLYNSTESLYRSLNYKFTEKEVARIVGYENPIQSDKKIDLVGLFKEHVNRCREDESGNISPGIR